MIVFGGASSEHEISLRSARSVLEAVDRDRFEPLAVGIGRDRVWRTGAPGDDPLDIVATGTALVDPRALAPDIVFPVLHGPSGEDGTIQGMLEILGLPYVGSGVLASAMCMDKVVQKQVLAHAAPAVPLIPWLQLDGRALAEAAGLSDAVARVTGSFGLPCFVKPANMGSSVGVGKAVDVPSLARALVQAAQYDHEIVVEQGIDAREIEVAILGNDDADIVVSPPGEIGLPPGVWYDYDTKYVNDVASLHIPAALPEDTARDIEGLAKQSFLAMGCAGLARIDFLLDRRTGTPYLNELNTMPGFTSISMYPKLMEHAGVAFRDLVTRLCELGLRMHDQRRLLSIER
jgi:D-alanine-D-alanine ligase